METSSIWILWASMDSISTPGEISRKVAPLLAPALVASHGFAGKIEGVEVSHITNPKALGRVALSLMTSAYLKA